MRILLAEDVLISSAMLQSDLKEWGYTPIAAGNGADAWQVLRDRQPPELALIDWMMPTIAGPDLCRRARELTHVPDPADWANQQRRYRGRAPRRGA